VLIYFSLNSVFAVPCKVQFIVGLARRGCCFHGTAVLLLCQVRWTICNSSLTLLQSRKRLGIKTQWCCRGNSWPNHKSSDLSGLIPGSSPGHCNKQVVPLTARLRLAVYHHGDTTWTWPPLSNNSTLQGWIESLI
jgi:hypothetical protein